MHGVERKKLRKLNEAGRIVEGKELKRERNNVGGEGDGEGPPYLYYVLFSSLGPTSTALKLVAAGTLH